MNLRVAGVIALAVVMSACGGHGAPVYQGPPPNTAAVFGQCAFCHNPMATNMVATAPDLKCQTCHADQEPGTVGPGHRCLPDVGGEPQKPCSVQPVQEVPAFPASGPLHLLQAEAPFGTCAYCHNDNAVNMTDSGVAVQCTFCHNTALLPNYVSGHRSLPGPEQVQSFPGPAHKLGPEVVFGQCAFCHNENAVHMVPVSNDLNCMVCHDDIMPGTYGPGHESRPGPERVPSFVGPSHLPPPSQEPFGACAYCHNDKAVNVAPVGDELTCAVCHDNRTPGTYGPGHEALPGPERVPSFVGVEHLPPPAQVPFGSCAYCHNDKAVNMAPFSDDLQCVVCHDDQTPGTFGPGHRGIPGPELVPSFAGPTHALGAAAPFGFCAYCHNDKAVNMIASGVGVACTFCHATELSPDFGPGHRSLPGPEQVQSFPGPAHKLGPEAVYGQCGFCHNSTTVTALMSSGHGDLSLVCENCHTVLRPNDYGPGHERAPRCAECHTKQHTHEDPAVGTVRECTNCHTPHGSSNIFLINEQIQTPNSGTHAVVFNNILGLADGSFASVSDPGTGLCETCHTRTEFYRNDGSGASHFPYPCFTCHPHAAGFSPN